MASRISHIASLLPELQAKLQSFTHSAARVCLVHTVNPTSTPPRTLYIVDSSFNPPSIAHVSLATSALRHPAATDKGPFRLLLLFSTHNADKAPSPASFEQRIAMMAVLAEDMLDALKNDAKSSSQESQGDMADVSIDIGLIKEPYYTDKSTAIAQSSPPIYPSNPIHVHLVGYDTLIRFCNPKYYPNHTPPLSALAPFFQAGHKLRVTQRPFDPTDPSSKEFGTVEQQSAYLQSLRDGKLENDGFEKVWGERIDMVAASEGVGISSTRVRRAAKEGDWEIVGELCTQGVAEWIRSQKLYSEDDSGKKMMD
ncbi:Nucleotidylyl transferase [Sporormia fimetaria CBS 119925]|uniref:Nucleotidylyl transferase n=1 Tax=Sporormia fimetaria CBS 119925 TaxID=1340428 RepID=A0A6A6UZS9_9PLEO|nr:Nucleotidylyl transferase [Sporormia fimetaria CBS 119925]